MHYCGATKYGEEAIHGVRFFHCPCLAGCNIDEGYVRFELNFYLSHFRFDDVCNCHTRELLCGEFDAGSDFYLHRNE